MIKTYQLVNGQIVSKVLTVEVYRQLRDILDMFGYEDLPATEESMRKCFKDLVAFGCWSDLDATMDDLDEYKLTDIIRAVSRLR